MTPKPDILQGTDGIRGRIAENGRLQGRSPLEFFLSDGLLTPAFFEKYCFAFATLLLDTGFAEKKDWIVVGWDPRDRENRFNQAAIAGIRKAGLSVLVAGILPTPAIPLYMLSQNALASVVLTASHNPSDQNGIKLFFGATALKFLPPDDKKLTSLIYRQEHLDLSTYDESGFMQDREADAKSFFIEFCTDPANAWIDGDDFSDTTLVVDASKGAVSAVAEPIFSRFRFKQIVYTNLEGNINEHCGVADLEGLERISRSDITGSGAKLESYQALKTMFDTADRKSAETAENERITGLVFDGDGDRCFRLDYDPGSDDLIVSSGDFLGVHQARFLRQQSKTADQQFINTVESDLNTAITAREMGFDSILTGVGDKWILSRAVVDMIEAVVADSDSERLRLQQVLENSEGLSGLDLTLFWKDFLLKKKPREVTKQTRFAIGIEESGHCITPGYLSQSSVKLPCFSGNGIKSGLNSLKAARQIYSSTDWYQSLSAPFEAGIKDTFYTYYVDKSGILPGAAFRQTFQERLKNSFYTYFPSQFTIEVMAFPEEKPMLYFGILENGKQCGAIFIRNSGTEDKSALYLRGEERLTGWLQGIGNELHLLMLLGLKTKASQFTRFEITLLHAIQQGDAVEPLLQSNPDLPGERILKEIEFKEYLIAKQKGSYSLTEKGRHFITSWGAND